jgi:hypothetical protein
MAEQMTLRGTLAIKIIPLGNSRRQAGYGKWLKKRVHTVYHCTFHITNWAALSPRQVKLSGIRQSKIIK